MARKIRFFKDQMTKAGILPSARFPVRNNMNMDELEGKLAQLEAELVEMNGNSENLQHTYNELVEFKLVLLKAGEFFQSALKVAAQQTDNEAHHLAERSIDSPLLREK